MKKTTIGMALIFMAFFGVSALANCGSPKQEKWTDVMLESVRSSADSKPNLKPVWKTLRAEYRNPADLKEMSWEERDNIWTNLTATNLLDSLGFHYYKAYRISCNERGVNPDNGCAKFKTWDELWQMRSLYLKSREQEYVILTPKAPNKPRINGALVYGARPGHEFIYKMPVSGKRPMKYSVKSLPEGCRINEQNGVITGVVNQAGEYKITMIAENKQGKDSKVLILKIGDRISLTPPMGWNSWNCFACDVTAKNIEDAALGLINSGLADYGWSFVNIDDCWMRMPAREDQSLKASDATLSYYDRRNKARQGGRIRFDEEEIKGKIRDENGAIYANKDFPDMKKLTGAIHNMGLKTGIYISPGPLTCQCYTGSYGSELKDADQFANWGFDYLKYDWCGYEALVNKDKTLEEMKKPYFQMRDALRNTNRDIIYSLCQYGMGKVWEWGAEAGGNCWRTTGDIRDTWESISKIGFSQAGLENYAGPGHWNDPDMLVVGYVGWNKNLRPSYLSPNEQYTHISLWSLLSAPLLIGADLTRLDDFTLNLLTNNEVLAVNQDELGKQASRIIESGKIQVWAKPLSDGSTAVGIFNVGELPVEYELDFSIIKPGTTFKVRDLWRQQDVSDKVSRFKTNVNRHGVRLIRIWKS